MAKHINPADEMYYCTCCCEKVTWAEYSESRGICMYCAQEEEMRAMFSDEEE